MELSLDKLEVGKSAAVKKLAADGKIRRRLFDMGITQGTSVYMRKVAPLGDPIEVTVRGYELTLRKDEAAGIIMEVL
ncbi:MAG: ferrous iron transport protein A [Clostridiales bacterium]|jgi:Fe2+ transport system protein FeoA|nr:ferrous iron transport protein A [Clostridiales bacterium]